MGEKAVRAGRSKWHRVDPKRHTANVVGSKCGDWFDVAQAAIWPVSMVTEPENAADYQCRHCFPIEPSDA